MDYRSMFMSFEDGVFIYNDEAVHDIFNDLNETFKESEKISLKDYLSRNIFLILLDYLLQVISPLF